MRPLWMILVSAILVTGCGNGPDYDHIYNSLGYEVSESFGGFSCSTGKHVFNTIGEYCDGLQSESLNNNCGISSRQVLFRQRCPGTFSKRI